MLEANDRDVFCMGSAALVKEGFEYISHRIGLHKHDEQCCASGWVEHILHRVQAMELSARLSLA